MTLGPIPWDKVVAYAERAGLSPEMQRVFEDVIFALDEVWGDWAEKERNKRREPTGRLPSADGKVRERRGRFGR